MGRGDVHRRREVKMEHHNVPAGMTTKEFYFTQVHGLSNSGLGKVEDWLNGKTNKVLPEKAFRFGSMVDAILTQPDELEDSLTDEEILAGIKLSKAALAHPLSSMILSHGKSQVILTSEVTIDFEGIIKPIEAKCMYDKLLLKMKIGADYKTTVAKDYAEFLVLISWFKYDRQAYWYMEIGNLDRFVLIGLSKTRVGEVFIHIVKRGDEMWQSGKDKAVVLAY